MASDDDDLTMDSSTNIAGLLLTLIIIVAIFMLFSMLCWAFLRKCYFSKSSIDLEQLESLLDDTADGNANPIHGSGGGNGSRSKRSRDKKKSRKRSQNSYAESNDSRSDGVSLASEEV